MIRSRSAFSMPANRPRRIWLNGVGAQNGAGKEEELKKSLPYCDLETGTKNRVVERDPIAGLGLLGKEYDQFLENRQRNRSGKDKDNRNPILGEGNLGQEVNLFNKPDGYKTSRKSRNPFDQTASPELEADSLRPKGKPGKVSIVQAQRDPISGRGEFGREWDPIHKYAGRSRLWHQRAPDDPHYYKLHERPSISKTDQKYISGYYAKRGGRCNPLTGDDAKSFDINQELRRTPRKGVKTTNPVTGENCESFTVSDKLNEKYMKTGAKKGAKGGNPVTGDNCKSFDFNIESKPGTPRKPSGQAAGNPITGDNCAVYAYNSEFKSKPNKPHVPQNPVTGENVKTFVLKLTEKEDQLQGQPRLSPSDIKNPLTGENCQTFTVNLEERPRTAPGALGTSRSSSNPVTGEGCQHYVLCNGEKKVSASPQSKEATSNPLTGDNVRSFDINQELRVNRRSNDNPKTVENGHQSNGVCIDIQTPRSNPITGM